VEKALKQRLTGAVILVIAGVVFIPLLLDGAGHHARFSKDVDIPPEPVIKIKSWDEIKEIPAKPATPVKQSSAKQSLKSAEKPSASTKKPVVSANKTTKPSIKAWALQLGSFSQQTNALVLRDQLRAKGYRAFMEKSVKQGKISYKVKVGPDLDRSKLEKVAAKLQKEEKITSLVITHP